MKAEEIRFNNYYLDEKGEVIQFTFSMMDVDMFDVWKPIELTSSWLERMGFEKDSEGLYLNIKPFPFLYSDKTLYIHDGRDWNSEIDDVIKYVHSLQNLIFALTGKELIINFTKEGIKSKTYSTSEK